MRRRKRRVAPQAASRRLLAKHKAKYKFPAGTTSQVDFHTNDATRLYNRPALHNKHSPEEPSKPKSGPTYGRGGGQLLSVFTKA